MYDDAYSSDRDEQLTALINAGQLTEALALLETWYDEEPWNGDLLMRMAVVHWLVGEPARTLRDLDAYLLLDPENAEALARRAQALLMLGKQEDAEAALLRAEAIDPTTPGVLLNRALIFEAHGDYQQAVTSLNAYLEQLPSDHLALARRSHLHRQLGEFQQALADAQVCVQMHPEDPETHFAEALAWVTLEQGEQALAACERCLQTQQAFLPAWRLRIDLEADMGKLAEAEHHMQELSVMDADSPHTSLLQARVATEREDYADALVWINRFLDDSPDEAHGLYRRGMIYYRMGDFPRAYVDFQDYTGMMPNSIEGYEQQFLCLLEMEQFDKAEEIGQTALELQPQNFRLQYNLAFAKLLTGKHDAATEGFILALRLAPDGDELALRIYLAFIEHGSLAERIQFFSTAIHQLPQPPSILKGLLAESFLENGDFDSALELTQQILSDDRDRPFGYLLAVKALCLLGKYPEAMIIADSGISILPDDGQLHVARSVILRDTGQPNEALHELDIAEKLLPDDADVLRQRALVHGSIGEVEEAVAVLQESLRLDGESTESYFWLGYFRIHLAQYQGALETAEQLLALTPMSAEGHIVRCAALRALHRHREADDELAWLTQQESDLLERLREDPVMEKLLNPHKEQEDGVVSRFRRSLAQRWQEIRRVKESH